MNNLDLVEIERIAKSIVKSMDLNKKINCEIKGNDRVEDNKINSKSIDNLTNQMNIKNCQS